MGHLVLCSCSGLFYLHLSLRWPHMKVSSGLWSGSLVPMGSQSFTDKLISEMVFATNPRCFCNQSKVFLQPIQCLFATNPRCFCNQSKVFLQPIQGVFATNPMYFCNQSKVFLQPIQGGFFFFLQCVELLCLAGTSALPCGFLAVILAHPKMVQGLF